MDHVSDAWGEKKGTKLIYVCVASVADMLHKVDCTTYPVFLVT